MSQHNPVAVLDHSRYVMACRRIGIALATIEDGHFDLLTPENVTGLLNAALLDLEEAHVVEPRERNQSSDGLNWNVLTIEEFETANE
jgi:hypothetical protein